MSPTPFNRTPRSKPRKDPEATAKALRKSHALRLTKAERQALEQRRKEAGRE